MDNEKPVLKPQEIDGAQELSGLRTMTKISTSSKTVFYSGPLPPSSEIKEYEKYAPGCAERFVASIEKEQEVRHTLAKAQMDNMKTITKLAGRGQTYVFICILASFATAAVCAYFKAYGASATAAGVAGVISYLTFSDKVKKS